MNVVDIGTLFGVRPATDQDLSSETLLQLMARNGVGQALTCSLKAIQFDLVAGNDETLALCKAHPQLHPVAAIDPRRAPDCYAEVARCARLGFVGYRLLREYQGWAIANQALRHVLRAIAATGLPAIVHVPASGDATALFHLAADLETPIVMAAVTYSVLSEALAVMADAPHLHLEAHRVSLPGQVELMVEQAGVDRLMYGSWAPLHAQRPSMDMVLGAEIDEASKAAILGGNARRVFRLGGEDST
jgi:predicted TIM-barrel fold metal-dependent hydrolase